MINRTMIDDDFLGLDSSMKAPVVTSAILHIILFIVTAFGIPFIARDHEILSQPISIEIVPIDELTQTNRVATPVKPKEEKKELPPPVQEKPSPPKMAEETPPEIEKPKPPELKEEVKEKPVEQLAPPKPEKKKEEVKPKEKPKLKPDTTKVEKKKEQDFDSLLKNLTPETKEEQPVESVETAENSAVDSAIAQLSDRLTMSEMDALRHQLQGCWNLGASAGGKYAEELIVAVRVQINRDRTVQNAAVVDMGRYQRDNAFRAAAEAALRALRNPRCTPLAVPPDKYNTWKNTIINFDPSDML
ncbi:MAG: energy transducer TonB [Alphaproteobacteria bacterium]|jgi:outer membrane biosynthesis protein TonB|nr:energy transducer TonB [Alphaproteobacteria bacterium]